MAENGNGDAPQIPPWAHVTSEAMVQELTHQVASQAQEMAAMRIYIEQLHHALGQMKATMETTEDANGAVVPAGQAG